MNQRKKTSKFEKFLEANRKLEKENELSGGFPYTLEFLDYNITINSVKVFEDYALFDYSVKKIDGGYINLTDVNITGNVNFKGREFYISSNDVERRWEYSTVRIISTGEIIAKENTDSPANLSFSINARSADGSYIAKDVSIKEEVYLTEEDYLSLNKKLLLIMLILKFVVYQILNLAHYCIFLLVIKMKKNVKELLISML